VCLSIVGVPGQERFAPVRASLLEGARAAVWVHPAGAPVDQTTASAVAELAAQGVPHVVFINERPGSINGHGWDPESHLPAPREVIRGDALRSRDAVRSVKEALWNLVLAEMRDPQHEGEKHGDAR
jgi:hypothetical protein